MMTARTLAAAGLCLLLVLAGCQHDQPQARRPLSPFSAGKAITDQALTQNVEYPYTAHLASLGNETALRVLMRLNGLDEVAAAQHGAVLTYLVETWGDKRFTAVLIDEQEPVQRYVAMLVRNDVWQDYGQFLAHRQTAAAHAHAQVEAPTQQACLAETPDTDTQNEEIDVVAAIDLGGSTGEQDLVMMRDRPPHEQKPEHRNCNHRYLDEPDQSAQADRGETCGCPAEKQPEHICPNAWCAMQHRFPCLHKLAMIRYGQYTAANVVGVPEN